MATLIQLEGLSCGVIDNPKVRGIVESEGRTVGVCGLDAYYLLLEEDGQYTPVCALHVAVDKDGMILPEIRQHF